MSPYQRGDVWYVRFTDETGRPRREASKARTKKEADLLEAELRIGADRAKKGLQPGQRNPTKLTLSQAAKKYLPRLKAETTRKNCEHMVAKHIDRSGLGALLLEHVTTAKIEDYLERLAKDESASPATQNRIRSLFSGCFRVAKKLGLFHGENPVRAVEMRKEPDHVERLIPPELVPELIADAPDEDWRLVIALAAYTGMRRSEIRRLDLVEHIDLAARVLTVVQSKTGVIRKVGVHRDLVPLIEAARKRGTDLSAHSWQKSALVIKAVLEDDDLVFHGLRHTWATRLVDCDARSDVVEFMGWGRRQSSTFRKHYLDFPSARLVEEIDKLTWPAVPESEPETAVIAAKRRGSK